MNETVWFDEPIERNGGAVDRLVVDTVEERGEEYRFRTPDGDTLVVPKDDVDRIE